MSKGQTYLSICTDKCYYALVWVKNRNTFIDIKRLLVITPSDLILHNTIERHPKTAYYVCSYKCYNGVPRALVETRRGRSFVSHFLLQPG